MPFQQKHLFNSQTCIQQTPKRTSRRQSKRNYQFKIKNPLFYGQPISSPNAFIPNLPLHIKNQLAQSDYLSYQLVNSLDSNLSQQSTINRRTSRFSKRLMAMKNALRAQEIKIQNIHQRPQTYMQNQSQEQNQRNFDLMEEQGCSMKLQYLEEDMMERYNCLQLQIQCGLMQKETQVQYYSEDDLPYINYQEYETYLDV